MQSIGRLSLATCALLGAIDAAAQTLPPANPSMGPPVTATMHANAASSNATTNPGPGSGAVSISGRSFDAVFPTILMGSDGLIVSVATKWSDQTPYVYLLDPTTLDPLATMKLVKSTTSDLAGGIYSYLDNNDRLVLVNADGDLQRISYSQQSSGTWSLNVESSVPIGYPDVVGLVPDYQGRLSATTIPPRARRRPSRSPPGNRSPTASPPRPPAWPSPRRRPSIFSSRVRAARSRSGGTPMTVAPPASPAN